MSLSTCIRSLNEREESTMNGMKLEIQRIAVGAFQDRGHPTGSLKQDLRKRKSPAGWLIDQYEYF